MKFTISRTSKWDGKPCKEATSKLVPNKWTHLPNQEKKIKVWTIEIKTLDELLELVNKYGEIILDENSLEIYDDYRE